MSNDIDSQRVSQHFLANVDKTNEKLSYWSSCASLSTNDNSALLDNPVGLIQKQLESITTEHRKYTKPACNHSKHQIWMIIGSKEKTDVI